MSAVSQPTPMSAFVRRNDLAVESYLERQNIDPESRWRGAIPGPTGLHEAGTGSGILVSGAAAYHHPDSKFRGEARLRARLKLAAEHMARVQTPDGNFDLLITNFNSPADTAFITRNLASAARLAREHGDGEMFGWLEPTLDKCGKGLVNGGIHTPNHRWVACAALAQLHELFPDRSEYVARADEWLMETIDIDEDGQYSEQSTAGYNAIVNDCLVTTAHKLNRPELLEPVRRNLEAMLHLLHPNLEVVTEISQRQDRNTIGTIAPYWFNLRYMARKDGDGRLETIVRALEAERGSLALLMEYPELRADGPEPAPIPDDYRKTFASSNLVRVRRGATSASIVPTGNSRFFALRRGEAVVTGVRFAAAFFGKGQFVPAKSWMRGETLNLEQSLEAAYYQPFGDGRTQPWGVDKWYELRPGRKATEINRIRYGAEITERPNGFDVRITAEGTDWVPLAVEINLREGGMIEGVEPAPEAKDAYLLRKGYATYRRGGDELRFGPGKADTGYTQVRGAEEKLAGPSVYITGYTPFDRTIEFRWG